MVDCCNGCDADDDSNGGSTVVEAGVEIGRPVGAEDGSSTESAAKESRIAP
jgi:hypothetical protein